MRHKASSPARIEAVDTSRRSVHNEGSTLLQDRLDGKVAIDFETARRLFALLCVAFEGVTAARRRINGTGHLT